MRLTMPAPSHAPAVAIATIALAPSLSHAAETITVGAPGAPTAVLWPLYIGIDRGFFAAEGISVDVIFARSSAGKVAK